jgi:hypothetical protein
LPTAVPGNTVLCFDNGTGQLGPCPGLPSSLVAGGGVTSGGLISTSASRFGTAWTVSKPGTGVYTLTLPGLNVGCTNPLLPVLIVSGDGNSAGFQQSSGFGIVDCLSGNVNMQINTYNQAGVATDRAFQFMAYRHVSSSARPVSAHPGATECTVRPEGAVECF